MPRWSDMKYAIIDVETTGGAAANERMTEIAIVLHDGERVLDTFSTLLNPERTIPWNITMITGITDAMVATAPRFYEVAKQIVEMTTGAVFVAHNVQFDYSFVREEFARLGFQFTRKKLCTVRLARKTFPGLRSYSLTNLKQHFGIHADRSHRALDDALATTDLFERILAAQTGLENIEYFIKQGIKENRLPQDVSLERLYEAPEACGVYYLHDAEGKTIYVGKSLNIRKRLFEHFADYTPKGEKMRADVADFSFEVTGSELAALLLESAEIKRLQPRINRAQRVQHYKGAIYTYMDERGYRCFAAGMPKRKNAPKVELLAEYPKVEHARNHLQALARLYELCPKLCHLDTSTHACFDYNIRKCLGACIGAEDPTSYNERAEEVLDALPKGLTGSFFLVETGRTHDEWAVTAVREGQCKGIGYLDNWEEPTLTALENCLQPLTPDPEASRIIRGYMMRKAGIRKVEWG